jgi:hypothetical protein
MTSASIIHASMREDLFRWWVRRMLEGDHEACVAMFRCGAVIWS